MNSTPHVRLGTRGSPLARWQADWVAARLNEQGVEVEIVEITTQGDVTAGPLGAIGGQGLFTKEIQRALLADTIDLAVHSLKDLPTLPVEGLALAAVPAREAPGDVLVSQHESLDNLPRAARVGTGSARRRCQLLHYRPDLQLLEIRGNVDTRLRKLDMGEYDAIVLAEAGLRRLGLQSRIRQVIPRSVMLPAVGQGALGLETRADDRATREAVAPLNDPDSHASVTAERALLRRLEAGCLAPVGSWAQPGPGGEIHLRACVLSHDGRLRLSAQGAAPPGQAARLGEQLAEELLTLGAAGLIAESHGG